MPTLYRCDGYVEEICGKCPAGEPHSDTSLCPVVPSACHTTKKMVMCEEYDRDPCGDPNCCDCFGGDGVSCK